MNHEAVYRTAPATPCLLNMKSIIEWWRQHEAVLPLLASLAKRILAIPASSSKSERVFSTGGNIVTAKRNRLPPKFVECLIEIKENMAMVDDFMENGGYRFKSLAIPLPV